MLLLLVLEKSRPGGLRVVPDYLGTCGRLLRVVRVAASARVERELALGPVQCQGAKTIVVVNCCEGGGQLLLVIKVPGGIVEVAQEAIVGDCSNYCIESERCE